VLLERSPHLIRDASRLIDSIPQVQVVIGRQDSPEVIQFEHDRSVIFLRCIGVLVQ
jgi:hypothetical protein